MSLNFRLADRTDRLQPGNVSDDEKIVDAGSTWQVNLALRLIQATPGVTTMTVWIQHAATKDEGAWASLTSFNVGEGGESLQVQSVDSFLRYLRWNVPGEGQSGAVAIIDGVAKS